MSAAESALEAMTVALIDSRSKGLSPAETAKAIDAAYPFGERKHWPYKAWLSARKNFFACHGLPRNGDHRNAKQRTEDLVSRMQADRHWK